MYSKSPAMWQLGTKRCLSPVTASRRCPGVPYGTRLNLGVHLFPLQILGFEFSAIHATESAARHQGALGLVGGRALVLPLEGHLGTLGTSAQQLPPWGTATFWGSWEAVGDKFSLPCCARQLPQKHVIPQYHAGGQGG